MATRGSQYPAGGDLPKRYYDCMDPFRLIGAAAAVTTKLKVVTGICIVSPARSNPDGEERRNGRLSL
jgi:alkanesulfonate monooxygenase SsuD/methylene tetrahydromethanopterin reductase-like flavin-dependent oxidoreductase (luciferase family)